jgi:RNA polymerase sigma factor (sigma-70 family)
MNEDTTLLHRFIEDRAEAAFTELVQRHLSLVYGTALRRVGGDVHLAEDVTQTVFISLARKAASLRNHASLAGWLYVSAHRATAEVVRREQRRKQREASTHSMNITSTSDDPTVDPAYLRPLLDDALVKLKTDDREAVVLRFYAQRSFAEIGTTLRITEEAARKRVDRALEKLHATLSRRGITSTVTALGSALTTAGITAAPATLPTQIATVVLAQTALLPAATLTASLASSLLPATAVAAVLIGLATIVPQRRANAAMADAIARMDRVVTTGVQSEIDELNHALALVRTAPDDAGSTATSTEDADPKPAKHALDPNVTTVLVTAEGTIQWEREAVNLDEFIERLAKYQRSAAPAESLRIVGMKGLRAEQFKWVFDEVRKAGITRVDIGSGRESDPQTSPGTGP